MWAKFGPDRTTGDDVYTVGRIHTQTDTHTLSYIDRDDSRPNIYVWYICVRYCKWLQSSALLGVANMLYMFTSMLGYIVQYSYL